MPLAARPEIEQRVAGYVLRLLEPYMAAEAGAEALPPPPPSWQPHAEEQQQQQVAGLRAEEEAAEQQQQQQQAAAGHAALQPIRGDYVGRLLWWASTLGVERRLQVTYDLAQRVRGSIRAAQPVIAAQAAAAEAPLRALEKAWGVIMLVCFRMQQYQREDCHLVEGLPSVGDLLSRQPAACEAAATAAEAAAEAVTAEDDAARVFRGLLAVVVAALEAAAEAARVFAFEIFHVEVI